MKSRFSLLIAAVVLTACTTAYEKLEDGIVIKLDPGTTGVKTLKLSVVSDRIIHVQASPTDTFPRAASLIIQPDLERSGDWSVAETADEIVVKTRYVQAHVAMPSGEVSFTDTTGQVVLQEQQGGGKHFIPNTVSGMKTHQLRQVFESSADEAF